MAKARKGYIESNDLIVALAAPILFHGLWNALATILGASSIIILMGMEVYFIRIFKKIIREAQRDEVLWGYAAGRAPVERY